MILIMLCYTKTNGNQQETKNKQTNGLRPPAGSRQRRGRQDPRQRSRRDDAPGQRGRVVYKID